MLEQGETLAGRDEGGTGAHRKARAAQNKRFSAVTTLTTNADMRAKDIEKLAGLSDKAEATLLEAAKRMKLSPRGYHRTIKLARTIADLAGDEGIEPPHMLEALQYRAGILTA